jgi:PKHD-type hydroxylase
MNNLSKNTYWLCEDALSKEFCESTLAQVDWALAETGNINNANPFANAEKRRTDVIWQHFMQPLGCIARAYIDIANQAADWMYSLTAQEDTQLGRYKSIDNGHYDWHIDCFPPVNGVQRKLSISILLSDPSTFEGGELQFKGVEDQKVLTTQGSIIVFPSFIEHRVTPVTKGVRYSAVTWVNGPAFK